MQHLKVNRFFFLSGFVVFMHFVEVELFAGDPAWFADYDVKFYKLDVNVSDTSTFIWGSSLVSAQILKAGVDSFHLNVADNITVDSVFSFNINSRYTHLNSVLSIKLQHKPVVGEKVDVQVFYHGSVNGSGFFNALTNKKVSNDISVTWTLSEPFGAPQWFPCKESLGDKADSSWVFITVPNNLKAGSNGILTKVVQVDSIHHRFEWKSHHVIDFYLISFAVSNYQDYSFYARLSDKDSVLVQNYIYNNPAYLEANKADIDRTGDFLRLFSKKYGIYPFVSEKYGHCTAPMGGGMEHQTMTTLSGFNFTLVAHELSHQWFGDYVTCATWQDIWVNEGFASYSEYIALDSLYSHSDAVSWLGQAHNYAFNYPDGSVYVPENEANDESRIFNYNLTYKKGGSIIHMLRYELQDDNLFFKILGTYLSTYKNSVARGDDFLKVVNSITGKDYTWFFKAWYYGKGFPMYDFSWKMDRKNLVLTSMQTPSAKDGQFFKMHFDVKLKFENGDTTIRLFQDSPQKLFSIPVKENVTSVQVSPENQSLMKVTNIAQVPFIPSFDSYMRVLPNPFSSEIRINFALQSDSNRLVKICDLTGAVQIEFNAGKNNDVTINTSELIPSVYLLYVADKGKMYVRKLVKTSH